ncbi:lysoplasmalogenase TMEM86B-like [Hoplias malabaricus]|uniref:lysoplasmalogenase TMEM86B-like n=1 Tax=Hoplias malabaricus TaxID=27720 RepID=UPI00346377A3
MDVFDANSYDRKNTFCTLFLSLLPFFASVAIYFYLWIPDSETTFLAAAVKSAPVISLALMVLYYNGWKSLLGVAGGLLFSAGGDISLIWPNLFLPGMICFALAHILYSVYFYFFYNSSHSKSCTGMYILYVVMWGIAIVAYVWLLPYIYKNSPNPSVFIPAVGVYELLIVSMATLAAHTQNPWFMLGGMIFMVSDFTLAVQQFKAFEHLEYGRHIVMTTYYLAQLLIAVGDVKATLEEEKDGSCKCKNGTPFKIDEKWKTFIKARSCKIQ